MDLYLQHWRMQQFIYGHIYTGDEMPEGIDARGIPTAECPNCASRLMKIVAAFDDDYEVAYYFLDAECWNCGTRLTAPTPIDLPEYNV